jgi:hypothetical protein
MRLVPVARKGRSGSLCAWRVIDAFFEAVDQLAFIAMRI